MSSANFQTPSKPWSLKLILPKPAWVSRRNCYFHCWSLSIFRSAAFNSRKKTLSPWSNLHKVFPRYFKVWSASSDMAGQFPWESWNDFLRYWYWADENSTLKIYRTVSKFSLNFFLFKMNRPLLLTYGNIIGIGLKPCMDTATLRTTLRRSGLSCQLIGTKSCQSYVCLKLKEAY